MQQRARTQRYATIAKKYSPSRHSLFTPQHPAHRLAIHTKAKNVEESSVISFATTLFLLGRAMKGMGVAAQVISNGTADGMSTASVSSETSSGISNEAVVGLVITIIVAIVSVGYGASKLFCTTRSGQRRRSFSSARRIEALKRAADAVEAALPGIKSSPSLPLATAVVEIQPGSGVGVSPSLASAAASELSRVPSLSLPSAATTEPARSPSVTITI